MNKKTVILLKLKLFFLIIGLYFFNLSIVSAQTDTLYGEYNGHCYIAILVSDTINWQNANIKAAGFGGQLASVTSNEENQFIYNLFKQNNNFWRNTNGSEFLGPWIGGIQAWGSKEPDGGWSWVTGEPLGFQAWADKEPNNLLAGNEDRICYYDKGLKMPWQWNDYLGRMFLKGFIIEIPNVTKVDAGSNKAIGFGDIVVIGGNPTAQGGKPPYTYRWYPSSGLDDITIPNPNASPNTTTMYYVTVYPEIGCPITDSVLVTISSPKITSNLTAFKPLLCKNQTTSNLSLTNTGLQVLQIDTMYFSGTDFQNFTLVPPVYKLKLNPGDTAKYQIVFTADINKMYQAVLTVVSNSKPNRNINIQLNAVKDTLYFEPKNDLIDLGAICINDIKDTSFQIINTGNFPAGIFLRSSSLFSVTPDEAYILPSASKLFNLHFNGSSTKIDINSQIKVIDSICGITENINLTVKISEPQITIDDLVIITAPGTAKDGDLVINNKGDMDVYINKPIIPDNRFVVVSPSFPILIKKQSSETIKVRYTPVDNFPAEVQFEISGSPCGITSFAKISADINTARLRLKVGNVVGFPGDLIEIPIFLIDTLDIYPYISSNIESEIYFNSTLLYPVENTPIGLVQQNKRYITLNLPLAALIDSTLTKLKFKVTLGNSEFTDVRLNGSKTKLNYGDASIDIISGQFGLLGICKEGGIRLVKNTYELMLDISPNPITGKATIVYELIEPGYTKVFVSNNLGEVVYVIYEGNAEPGKYSLPVEFNEIGSGVYILTLQTPTNIISLKIVIIK